MIETKTCKKCGCNCHCGWDSCENGACGCDICDCGTTSEEEVPSSFFTPTNVASA